jgi:hypothetical protein
MRMAQKKEKNTKKEIPPIGTLEDENFARDRN